MNQLRLMPHATSFDIGNAVALARACELSYAEPDVIEAARGPGTVRDVMAPMRDIDVLTPETRGNEAMHRLAKVGDRSLPVVDRRGTVVGLLNASDVMRWTSFHKG